MESELERLRRANAELQAWVKDLLQENSVLRRHIAEYGEVLPARVSSARAKGAVRSAA